MLSIGRRLGAALRRCRSLVVLSALAAAAGSVRAEQSSGIYVLSTARDNPLTTKDERLANIRTYDFVSGYTLRVFWSDIEPTQGQYNFDVIDSAIQTLSAAGRGLNLEVLTTEEPAYVLGGASSTYIDHRGGASPVPWDAFAQQRHAALYSALANHVVNGAGAPHLLRDDPTLRSLDAAPAGLNFGVRDLNGAIRALPDYTQQRYIDAVAASVSDAATAFPNDTSFLAFFAFNDGQPGVPVDEQIIDRLAPLYNGAAQPRLDFFVENLSDDGPLPQANGMGPGNNMVDWVAAGGDTMMQALDSWLLHTPTREPMLDSHNPAAGISLANSAYGTRFFELYISDIDGAAAGALDAAGRSLIDDLRAWNAALTASGQGPTNADFDGDGRIDADDLAAWSTNFGLAGGATPAHGDANADQAVDAADFLAWQREVSAPASLEASLAAGAGVPEPTAAVLTILALAALLSTSRSR